MERRKVVSIVGAVVAAGVLASIFVFAEQINPSFAQLPGSPQIPIKPFRLGLDLQGGVHLVYQADLSRMNRSDYDSAMEGLRDVIERRINFFGIAEPLVQVEGRGEERRLIVEIAGVIDPSQAVELIGRAPFLEFREPKENYEEIVKQNKLVAEKGEGELEDPFQSTGLTGGLLRRSEVGFDQFTQEPFVLLYFSGEGAQLFQEITKRNIAKPVAIYLDNVLISAPIVQSEIAGGQAQITGRFTIEEARTLVRELNAGAIPVSIELLSQKALGPTLGKVSLDQSLRAGIVGLLLVAAFMIAFYRLPGILAVGALLWYGVFLLFILKIVGFTFTLAGIAGVILSLGMAVDANILIFSRFREELREGKAFGMSMEEGFRRAWPSIRDGNLTTLLVGIVLFLFGTSFVQGFALALSLGILLSMISAIFVTKSFLRLFQGTSLEKRIQLWK